jgi:putative endopeptidase
MTKGLGFSLLCTLMAALPGAAIAQQGEEYQTNERGLDRRNMDTSVNACQDFYQFANGAWLERNPIPADQSNWGIGNEMRERNYLLLRAILDGAAAAGAEEGTNKQKVGDFWLTGMDTETIETDGLRPLAADLQRTCRTTTSKARRCCLARRSSRIS